MKEIRNCRDCETFSEKTPLVYCGKNPRLFVVSEIPPKGAWENDQGDVWVDTMDFANTEKGTTYEFCKAIGIIDEADDIPFWIQRANCYHNKGKQYMLNHCSCKFIRRAIRTVKPEVIVALGKTAASWFLQFNKLSDVIGERHWYVHGSLKIPFVAMIHTSASSARWRKKYRIKQQESIARIKNLLST